MRSMKGGTVYRVFEALNELGAIVEEARGVPMTAGCVVPRGDVLELIDDIKDAIPGELDDAQDVLDARDTMLREAQEHAESTVANANAEADSLLSHSRAEADRLLADAKSQAAVATSCAPLPARTTTCSTSRVGDAAAPGQPGADRSPARLRGGTVGSPSWHPGIKVR